MTRRAQVDSAALISVFLVDYEKIRDEICMRISQRHQFTNYSLFLFVALASGIGALSGSSSPVPSLPFGNLTSDVLFLVLLAPALFYALLAAHLRHDHYIVFMTVYIEKHIAEPVRALVAAGGGSGVPFELEYLLGWEKKAQSYREPPTKRLIFLSSHRDAVRDLATKYSPYLLPVAVLLSIAALNVLSSKQHEIIRFLFGADIAVFICCLLCTQIYTRRRLRARSEELESLAKLSAEQRERDGGEAD